MQKQQPFDTGVHSCLTYMPFLWLLHALRALATQVGQKNDFKWNQRDVHLCRDACVQHTGLYKAHKQEGTIALHAWCTNKGHSAHLPKHPYISGRTACLTTKQICCHLELISISYNWRWRNWNFTASRFITLATFLTLLYSVMKSWAT